MIILTPNRRLTAFSLQQYNAQQESEGKQSWITPQIYPIEIWLLQLWDLCLDHNFSFYKPLLSIKQQQLLFEQIIQADNTSAHLLRINATAQNALQAWTFLSQWQIDLHKLGAYAQFNADTAALHTWLNAYLDWLQAHEYVDFNLMVTTIIQHIDMLVDLLPKQICLRGFNELPPQYATLVELLQDLGVEVTTEKLEATNAIVTQVSAQDADAELNTVVAWLEQQMLIDDQQTFGVVIPDLVQRRDRVYNAFTAKFPKQWLNISAPKSLQSFNVISDALLILKMSAPVVQYSDFSTLLRSAFIADFSKNANQRALLDRELRSNVEAQCTLLHLLRSIDVEHEVRAYLENFQVLTKELHGKHAPYYWVQKIQELLQCWGWPGERVVSNGADALIQALAKDDADLLSCWQNLLEEYSKLDTILPAHTFPEAIQYIRRFALETPFAPAETGLTKIHVLGLLEAEGLVFDHLWICGMSRDQWPPAANPNPFIPLELQREYDLPHSSAQRELLMAKKYTTTLQHGGKQTVIFSYPLVIDANPVAASNLIAHLPLQELPARVREDLFAQLSLETWHDDRTIQQKEAYASGGTKILQLQAQCPFKANAEIRLKAKPLQEPQNFLTPDKRGTLVHRFLEKFWQQCTSHAQLVTLDAQQLEATLHAIVQDILQDWQHKFPHTLTKTYIALESDRLYKLISKWLDYEKLRQPFVVYQLETKSLIAIGPLQFNMQLDRVDQVGDQFVIIDYKTGDSQIRSWSADQLYDPQLQIYAVGFPQDISAVSFAALIPNGLKFKGLACDADLLPKVKFEPDWEQKKQDWMQGLTKLAQDFMNGDAQVAPHDTKVCRNCNLQAMCRIYEH